MPRGLNKHVVAIHEEKALVSFELKHDRNMKVRVDTEDTGRARRRAGEVSRTKNNMNKSLE